MENYKNSKIGRETAQKYGDILETVSYTHLQLSTTGECRVCLEDFMPYDLVLVESDDFDERINNCLLYTSLAQKDTGSSANRHMRQILRIYNGASREMSLPLKN